MLKKEASYDQSKEKNHEKGGRLGAIKKIQEKTSYDRQSFKKKAKEMQRKKGKEMQKKSIFFPFFYCVFV